MYTPSSSLKKLKYLDLSSNYNLRNIYPLENMNLKTVYLLHCPCGGDATVLNFSKDTDVYLTSPVCYSVFNLRTVFGN